MSEVRVPNEPVRRAFERSGLTIGELANRVYGETNSTTRAGRQIGLYAEGGTNRMRETMPATLACQFLEALGLDPVDVGL